jgi:ABC-type sugar transport system ATPase subunit
MTWPCLPYPGARPSRKERIGVEPWKHFEPIVIKMHPQPLADQSRGNRVEHFAQREGAGAGDVDADLLVVGGRAADVRTVRRAGEKVLSVQNLSMQNVVRNTSFSIFAGQITGIFGLVGSGRTETARIIAGVAKRDLLHGGDMRLDGKSVRYRTPRKAVSDGVVYVTEDRKGNGLFETMSVAENFPEAISRRWSSQRR